MCHEFDSIPQNGIISHLGNRMKENEKNQIIFAQQQAKRQLSISIQVYKYFSLRKMMTSLTSFHSGQGKGKQTLNCTPKICCICINIYMHTHILDMHVHTHKYMQSLHKNFVYFVFFPLYILKFNNLVWVVIESLEVNLLNSRTTISYSYNNIHSDL